MTKQFIKDIAPFFHLRPIVYVDIGAYKGLVAQQILNSGMNVREVHLVEPNPRSFSDMNVTASNWPETLNKRLYNTAIGAEPGIVRMSASGTMTKVIDRSQEIETRPPQSNIDSMEGQAVFEAECTTLDKLSVNFLDGRASILKIDAEGSELDIIIGAAHLLSNELVDVIYIEAGFSPSSTQHTYYRHIEDALAAYGYKLFRIYEQKNEWVLDRADLRRANLAFFSKNFSDNAPLSLIKERQELIKERSALIEERSALIEQRENLTRDIQASKTRIAELSDSASELAKARLKIEELSDTARELAKARRKIEELENNITAYLSRQKDLEDTNSLHLAMIQRYSVAAVSLVGEVRRLLHARNVDLAAQKSRIEGRFSNKLGRAIVDTRSLRSALTLPSRIASAHKESKKGRTDNNSNEIAVDLPHLRVGGFIATHKTGRMRGRVLAGRVLYITGLATGSRLDSLDKLRCDIDFYSASGDLIEAPRDASFSSTSPTVGADGLIHIVALIPERATTVELSVTAAAGDVVHIQLDRVEQPRPETAARWQSRWKNWPSAFSKLSGPIGHSPRPKGGKGGSTSAAKRVAILDVKLWGGYANVAVSELTDIRDSHVAPSKERAAAAWSLARWKFVEGAYDEALADLDIEASLVGTLSKERVFCRVLSLFRLERYAEAADVLATSTATLGASADLVLLNSTALRGTALLDGKANKAAESLQLSEINKVLDLHGAERIVLKDKEKGLRIWNLATAASPRQRKEDIKVSVIMPVYNGENTISYAIDSLLNQTWDNIELIVVDDCSTDGTVERVRAIQKDDARIRIIECEQNRGSYPCRNDGLGVAVGELIMVHDADDWSHPEKIERQVDILVKNPSAKASLSTWIRVDEALQIIGPWIPKPTIFDLNLSSLLFRRSVVDSLGPWDEVRVSGDAEFRSRIIKAYGADAIITTREPAFLSLALTRPESLTQAGPTNIRTIKYGLRAQYRDSYADWHRKGEGQPDRLKLDPKNRPYVVPEGVKIARADSRQYDIVVVCDFALKGGAFGSTLNYIIAARQTGLTVAVCHWRKYDLRADAVLNPRLYDVCKEYGVDILTSGDEVRCETVLIGYTAILQQIPDSLPTVTTDYVLVLVNQFSSRLVDGSDSQYDPLIARENLVKVFGQEGTWIPISNWVHRLMKESPSYPAPFDRPWHPMIQSEDWFKEPISWRGSHRSQPVVGRHARDAYTKWPATARALAEAYCADCEWPVRLLGGAKHALDLIGHKPKNWEVLGFDAVSTREFLFDIDIFIHYPHELYIEEFGRAVLEAMAAGKPVILPDQFKETFGDAVLYAAPSDVAKIVRKLWSDEDFYRARAEIGRAFVLESSDISGFHKRYYDTLQLTPERKDLAQ